MRGGMQNKQNPVMHKMQMHILKHQSSNFAKPAKVTGFEKLNKKSFDRAFFFFFFKSFTLKKTYKKFLIKKLFSLQGEASYF